MGKLRKQQGENFSSEFSPCYFRDYILHVNLIKYIGFALFVFSEVFQSFKH